MYLGIDIGTSGVKAILVDEEQHIVDQAVVPLRVNRPKALWSEQNLKDWWEATTSAVKQLDAFKRSGVKAIAAGLSGDFDTDGAPITVKIEQLINGRTSLHLSINFPVKSLGK